MILTLSGCNIDNWTLDELKVVISEFKESHESQEEDDEDCRI